MNDGFFDRVIGSALERGAAQFVLVGAGHEGRAPRHAGPGIRWWTVGEQAGHGGPVNAGITVVRHDPARGGLGARLTASGFEPDATALFCCDAAAIRLSQGDLATLLAELRSLATPGTRLALALPAEAASAGEPDAEDGGLFGRGRWRATEISERAQRAGFRMPAPVWAPAAPGVPASAGRIAAFTERMLYRSAVAVAVAEHLEAVYGVSVKRTR